MEYLLPASLTPLERAILQHLLQGPEEVLSSIAAQLAQATVASRENTGVGGYTNFAVPASAPFYGKLPNMEVGTSCTHPMLQTAGFFILFVREGQVSFLEWVTADDAWPVDESLFVLPQV